jgi:hypothetical protein
MTIENKSTFLPEQSQLSSQEDNGINRRFESLRTELEELRAEYEPTYEEIHEQILRMHSFVVDKVIIEENLLGEQAKETIAKIGYELLGNILNRVFHDTKLKSVLDETIGAGALLHDLQKQEWPVAITFGKDFKKSTTSGSFSRKGIEISSCFTDPIFILDHLAAEGFDHTVKTLHHEFIHFLQDESRGTGRVKKFISLLSEPKNVSLLQELHAFMAENRLGATIQQNSVDEYLKTLKESYHLKETDMPKIEAAFWDIKKIYTLGISEKELARLTTLSRWNQKTTQWNGLHNRVTELMRLQDITDEEMTHLIEFEDIQSEITLRKIRKISREEIQGFIKK